MSERDSAGLFGRTLPAPMRAALPLLLALPSLDAFAGMGRIHRTRHVAARTAVSPIAAADPAADASPSTDDAPADGEIITFTDGAMTQLVSLREKQGADQLNVRMGVRAGGCSGMSYVMDVMDASKPIDEADTVIEFDQARRHRRHPARASGTAPQPPPLIRIPRRVSAVSSTRSRSCSSTA